MVETHHHAHGTFGLSEAERAHAAQKKQEAVEKLNRVLARQKKNQDPLLGYGSTTTTERGIQLNLDQRMAAAVVGQDQLDNLQKEAGKRRLSQHRGSWKSLGLERWRGALENYVASVKPGNQTALNTARVPFSRYLNQIHQRLHEVFAHGFLGHLEQLPDKHPLNNQEMSTHVEIALSREDGRVVKMGITKSSGVTAFDVGALESVSKAAPYGPPPSSIVSSDGNVYLHWEFHRKRVYACSTYFARPYIIDVGPESAPPRVEPPRKPQPDEEKKPDERSGALEQDTPDQPRLRPG
jgi:TonB family protein